MKRIRGLIGVVCALLLAASWALGESGISALMERYSWAAQAAAESQALSGLGLELTAREEEIFRLGVACGYDLAAGGGSTVSASSETLVWVPTRGGSRYHDNADCSGMIDPLQVTIQDAKTTGFTPCGRCHPPEN